MSRFLVNNCLSIQIESGEHLSMFLKAIILSHSSYLQSKTNKLVNISEDNVKEDRGLLPE